MQAGEIELRLTAEEAFTLSEALRSYLSELRMEVADTERQRVRDLLKEREHQLQEILARLTGE